MRNANAPHDLTPHRLRHTPLRDLARGGLTAAFDWRRVVAASGLSAAEQAVVVAVVHRTRLWRSERAAVARELIAHFQDAAAGASSATALADFGDRRAAARLPPAVGDLTDMNAERPADLDLVQQAFTDDGHGNGRLTAEGLAFSRRSKPRSFPTKHGTAAGLRSTCPWSVAHGRCFARRRVARRWNRNFGCSTIWPRNERHPCVERIAEI